MTDGSRPAPKPQSGLLRMLRRWDDRADVYARRKTGADSGTPSGIFASTKSLGLVLYFFMAGIVAVVRGLVAGQPAVVVLGVLVLIGSGGFVLYQRRSGNR